MIDFKPYFPQTFDTKNTPIDTIDWIGFNVFVNGEYEKNQSAYHNISHIQYVLNKLPKTYTTPGVDWKIKLAAIFHDIAYNVNDITEMKNHEALSNQKFVDYFKDTMDAEHLNYISQLILSTKETDIDAIRAYYPYEALFLHNADFGILAESEKHYEKYTRNIRAEFQKYGIKLYLQGRIHFLKLMKAKAINNTLFANVPDINFSDMHERATKNTMKEIDELQLELAGWE